MCRGQLNQEIFCYSLIEGLVVHHCADEWVGSFSWAEFSFLCTRQKICNTPPHVTSSFPVESTSYWGQYDQSHQLHVICLYFSSITSRRICDMIHDPLFYLQLIPRGQVCLVALSTRVKCTLLRADHISPMALSSWWDLTVQQNLRWASLWHLLCSPGSLWPLSLQGLNR